MLEKQRPKIGLALGSGGSKGLAHLGVIKVLEENKIPIDFIAGTSIGAVVGGFYASGLKIKEMEEIVLNINWRKMLSLVDPRLKQGLITGEKIKVFIEKYIGNKKIENCRIPFAAVATDLKTGESVIFNKGEMAQAIRASISIPLIFKPVEINGRLLIDGGASLPVPAKVVKEMGADIVIAVNLNTYYYDEKVKPQIYNIINNALNVLYHHLALNDIKDADLVINVKIHKNNYWYQFVNGQDKILIGEEAAKEMLPKLQELIKQKQINK